MDAKSFSARYDAYRTEVEAYLAGLFTGREPWDRLYEAMRYSLLSGGKRLRPVLTLECARLGGLAGGSLDDWHRALPFACALELVHTYSLIHDDLPCMDDDALRRGKPANHVVFGETLATLAGDALQPEAYRLIAGADLSAQARLEAVDILARASGADGMVAGQVLDLDPAFVKDEETLRMLHARKTGAMLAAAARLGCAAAEAPDEPRLALVSYAAALGLAFQIRDDMLDVIGDEATFGKPIGSDRAEGRTTFVDLLGLDGCAAEVRRRTEAAVEALAGVAGAGFLIALARGLAERDR